MRHYAERSLESTPVCGADGPASWHHDTVDCPACRDYIARQPVDMRDPIALERVALSEVLRDLGHRIEGSTIERYAESVRAAASELHDVGAASAIRGLETHLGASSWRAATMRAACGEDAARSLSDDPAATTCPRCLVIVRWCRSGRSWTDRHHRRDTLGSGGDMPRERATSVRLSAALDDVVDVAADAHDVTRSAVLRRAIIQFVGAAADADDVELIAAAHAYHALHWRAPWERDA